MEYIIYFDIAAICVLITARLAYGIRTRIWTVQNIVYRIMIYASLVMAVSDILMLGTIKLRLIRDIRIVYALKSINIVAYLVIAIAFAIYSAWQVGKVFSTKQGRSFFAMMLPGISVILLLIIQCFRRCVFYIDEQKHYHRMWGMGVVYLCVLIYLMVGLYYLLRFHYKTTKENVLVAIVFSVVVCGTTILQFVMPRVLLTPFGTSLCILLYLIAMEKPQENIEPEFHLYNQRALLKMASERFMTGEKIPVLIIKVHNVKVMRQAIGVERVDEILHQMGDFFKQLNGKMPVYHFSQSVFVMLFDRKNYASEMQILIRAIQERFQMPWKTKDIETKFMIHMASIVCPQDAGNMNTFVDYIQYVRASSSERKNTVLYAQDMNITKHNREMKIRQMLTEAVENDGFEVFYQPVYTAADEKLVSAEALVRLKDQSIGYVSPEEFIGIAEQSGYITQIGEFVFETVCKFMHDEYLEDYGITSIAVNLSTIQCLQENLAERFREIMDKYEIRPDQIHLEITESVAAHNVEVLKRNIAELNNMGICFSLDDYGSGYSNTDYLFKFPIHTVKIDKLMLWEAFKNEKAKIAMRNTIRMIKELGLEVVAEGVETQESVDYLREHHCDYLQGFYFSKPIPASRFLELLRSEN